MPYIKIKCLQCQKIFDRYHSNVYRRNFCTKQCYYDNQIKKRIRCYKCKKIKYRSSFYPLYGHGRKVRNICKSCHYEETLIWHRNNKDKIADYDRKRASAIKIEILSHYSGGNPICECCGEKTIEFLCLDHVNGGGSKERKKLKMIGKRYYFHLKKLGYPMGFRVLCCNCNVAEGLYFGCPHKKVSDSEYRKVID